MVGKEDLLLYNPYVLIFHRKQPNNQSILTTPLTNCARYRLIFYIYFLNL